MTLLPCMAQNCNEESSHLATTKPEPLEDMGPEPWDVLTLCPAHTRLLVVTRVRPSTREIPPEDRAAVAVWLNCLTGNGRAL